MNKVLYNYLKKNGFIGLIYDYPLHLILRPFESIGKWINKKVKTCKSFKCLLFFNVLSLVCLLLMGITILVYILILLIGVPVLFLYLISLVAIVNSELVQTVFVLSLFGLGFLWLILEVTIDDWLKLKRS